MNTLQSIYLSFIHAGSFSHFYFLALLTALWENILTCGVAQWLINDKHAEGPGSHLYDRGKSNVKGFIAFQWVYAKDIYLEDNEVWLFQLMTQQHIKVLNL